MEEKHLNLRNFSVCTMQSRPLSNTLRHRFDAERLTALGNRHFQSWGGASKLSL